MLLVIQIIEYFCNGECSCHLVWMYQPTYYMFEVLQYLLPSLDAPGKALECYVVVLTKLCTDVHEVGAC